MPTIFHADASLQAQVIDLITRERAKALSPREWRHRLAGYGYAIRTTDAGQFVESLSKRIAICPLPAELSA